MNIAKKIIAFFLAASPLIAAAQVVMVLNSRDATVSVLDQKTGKQRRLQDVGKEPHHLYPSPDNKQLFIANAQSDDLVVLDPLTGLEQRRIKNIRDPYHLGFSPDKQWFVVNALRLNRVDIYKPQGNDFVLIKSVPTSKMPSHMVFSADSKTVYVTAQGENELNAIDLASQTVQWKLKIGDTPAGLWLTPAGLILSGIMGSDYVAVIDPAKRAVIKKIPTGKGAHALRGAGDGKQVFVSNREAGTISVLDMQTLEKLHDLPAPGGPDCMEVTADGKQLWVTSRWAKKLTVIDTVTRTVAAQYPVGRSPHGVYFHDRAAWK